MKKIIILFIPIFIYVFISYSFERKNIIPKEAIRVRILANSNSQKDQNEKLRVKNNLEPFLYSILKDEKNIYGAKSKIISNLNLISDNIKSSLENNTKYAINFGKNYFPKKEYKGIIYEEGYYDSLLITLGDGLGDNWWCVLFPPLCLLEGKEYSDVEYTTFVSEILSKY